MAFQKGHKFGRGNSNSGRKTRREEVETAAKNMIENSKTFKELLNEMIPNKLIVKKHLDLLNAEIKVTRGDIEITHKDTQAISKALDMLYKIKGKYAPQKIEQKTTIDLEGAEKIDELFNFLNKNDIHERTNLGTHGNDTNEVDREVRDKE